MTGCGYCWVTYVGTRLVGSHECRLEHDWDRDDPIHVCVRCGRTPDIDTATNSRIGYRHGVQGAIGADS